MRTILVSFFVFLTVLANTFFAYREWSENQSYFDFGYATPLSETSTIQSVSAPEGKRLVPQGAIMGENDVDEICYTYFVDVQSGKDLQVDVTNAYFEKNDIVTEDTYGLLNFEISINMISDSKAEVTVIISLDMPHSQEIANMIIGSSASFKLNFRQIDTL